MFGVFNYIMNYQSRTGFKRKRTNGAGSKTRRYKKRAPSYIAPVLAKSEVKYHDIFPAAGDDTTVSTTGVVLFDSLNKIGTGSNAVQRIGKNIWIKKIFLRARLILPESASESRERCRIIVLLDKQHNSASVSPDFDDFLQAVTVTPFIRVESFYNLEESIGQIIRNIKINISCNQVIYYKGTTNALDQMTSANISVHAISDRGACTLKFLGRIRFTD